MEDTQKYILIVHVVYTIKSGLREEFYNKLHEHRIIDETRRENGNFKYDYFFPAEHADDILLVELWADEPSQKAHLETAHYKILTELKKEYVVDFKIEKFLGRKI